MKARPTAQVVAGLTLLPESPGVYLMHDAAGRVIYIGRSKNLRARVRSYWGPLADRRRLRSMRERVAWVEPVLTTSEHEAAFLERHLLTRRRPAYNRALGGMESWVWLRLATLAGAPGLVVTHEPDLGPGETLFGPYLGGGDARNAAAALLRLYPIHYTAVGSGGSLNEMARVRGVGPEDRLRLAKRIRAVLERRPDAVGTALAELAMLRDGAAAEDRFEDAALRQAHLLAVDWLAQAQKVAMLDGLDFEVAATATARGASVRVAFEVKKGSFWDRHTTLGEESDPQPPSYVDPHWLALAQANAELLARMHVAGAVGLGLGRLTALKPRRPDTGQR